MIIVLLDIMFSLLYLSIEVYFICICMWSWI